MTQDRAQKLYNKQKLGEMLTFSQIEAALEEERTAEFNEWMKAFIANGFNDSAGGRMEYKEYVRRFSEFDRRRKTFLYTERREIAMVAVETAPPSSLLAASMNPTGSAIYWVGVVCGAIEEYNRRKSSGN